MNTTLDLVVVGFKKKQLHFVLSHINIGINKIAIDSLPSMATHHGYMLVFGYSWKLLSVYLPFFLGSVTSKSAATRSVKICTK